MTSVADPDDFCPNPVRSEPFWSDPDPNNCPDPVPDPTLKSHKTRKKSNKLNIYNFLHLHFYKI